MRYLIYMRVAFSAILIAIGFFSGYKLFSWALKEPVCRHMFWLCLLYMTLYALIQIGGNLVPQIFGFPDDDLFVTIFSVTVFLTMFSVPIYKTWHSTFSIGTLILYLLGSSAILFAIGMLIVMFLIQSAQ